MLVPSLQNCFLNYCNLSLVTFENFPVKGNLKYQIFFLVLLDSVLLGILMIFLLKYFLTDLSINLGGYSLF